MTALLKPLKRPYATLEYVTPNRAEEWLAHNTHNRRRNDAVVRRYSRDFEAKAWKITASMLGFDINGVLLDGQHRLQACINTGIPFWTFVAWDLDPDSFDVIDQNYIRTAGQVLAMQGEINCPYLASAVRFLDLYEGGRSAMVASGSKSKMTQNEIRDMIDRNPGLRESVSFIRGLSKLRTFSASTQVATVLHYKGAQQQGRHRTDAFFEALNSGEGLMSGNPIFALREKLLNLYREGSYKRALPVLAIYLPAWNAYIAGRKMVQLRPLDWGKLDVDLTIR